MREDKIRNKCVPSIILSKTRERERQRKTSMKQTLIAMPQQQYYGARGDEASTKNARWERMSIGAGKWTVDGNLTWSIDWCLLEMFDTLRDTRSLLYWSFTDTHKLSLPFIDRERGICLVRCWSPTRSQTQTCVATWLARIQLATRKWERERGRGTETMRARARALRTHHERTIAKKKRK